MSATESNEAEGCLGIGICERGWGVHEDTCPEFQDDSHAPDTGVL